VLLIALGLILAISVVLQRILSPGTLGGEVWLLFWAGLVIFVYGLVRYVLLFAISRIPYVQCTPRNVRIQTPFMPVVFSYRRFIGSRPTYLRDVYPPNKQKGWRRKMLEGLWGETVIIVDLKGYPMSKQLLRHLMGPYLLTPRGTGFVFLVKDWMALNRQLTDYYDQWRMRTTPTVPAAQRSYIKDLVS